MCGKYVELSDSYKSLNEALRHAGIHNHARVKIEYDRLGRPSTPTNVANLARFDAILVPGGFGKRGVEGKILAAQLRAREQDPLPRHLPRHAGRDDRVRAPQGRPRRTPTAPSSTRDAEHPVIALIDEWEDRDGSVQKRTAQSDLGGTMRLGAQSSDVKPGTLAHEIYGNVVTERHRHRYEANENYLDRLHRGRPGDLGAHPARAS